MKFTVYGIRFRGDKEVRYIGQTNGLIEARLAGHVLAAKRRRHNLALCDWISENTDSLEIFKIGYADTREEARGIERAIIALCSRLDHRLFNLPTGRRPARASAINSVAVRPVRRPMGEFGTPPRTRPHFMAEG